MEDTLARLEADLGDTRHIIGHNILRHDLPHLAALRPRLAQLAKAPVDTLWLNPLAFPAIHITTSSNTTMMGGFCRGM